MSRTSRKEKEPGRNTKRIAHRLERRMERRATLHEQPDRHLLQQATEAWEQIRGYLPPSDRLSLHERINNWLLHGDRGITLIRSGEWGGLYIDGERLITWIWDCLEYDFQSLGVKWTERLDLPRRLP